MRWCDDDGEIARDAHSSAAFDFELESDFVSVGTREVRGFERRAGFEGASADVDDGVGLVGVEVGVEGVFSKGKDAGGWGEGCWGLGIGVWKGRLGGSVAGAVSGGLPARLVVAACVVFLVGADCCGVCEVELEGC